MRNYQSSDVREHEVLQQEIEPFKARGGVLTFSVNTDMYKNKLGWGGYRFFRIRQTAKNSGNSHVLCLSGMELYGRVNSGRWP